MADWIDQEFERRQQGQTRGLLQSQHAEVNAQHPGCTLEYCGVCEEPTGNAGRGEDSLFCAGCGVGPFCWGCWQKHGCIHTVEAHAT
jgi:hypothetical protein